MFSLEGALPFIPLAIEPVELLVFGCASVDALGRASASTRCVLLTDLARRGHSCPLLGSASFHTRGRPAIDSKLDANLQQCPR
jgi:hypothetical protein